MLKRILVWTLCIVILSSALALPAGAAAVRIKYGDEGSQVTDIQNYLKAGGYYAAAVDGKYGYRTYLAVRAFQQAHNLYVDGVVGPDTLAALGGSTTTVSVPAPAATVDRIKFGDTGVEVVQIQSRLKELGYFGGVVDGKFGYYTYTRITWFQEKNGLKADGVVGPKTWAKLFSADAITLSGKVYPVISTPSGWVKYGDVGSRVFELQSKLTALGYSPGGIDGKFGYLTYLAVRAFQKDKGIKVDGIAGEKTWALLFP